MATDRLANPARASDPDKLRSAVSGKTVLVTGASYGIGEATARRLAAAGATVLVVARSAERLDDLAASINAGGGHAFAYPTDLTDEAAVHVLTKQITENHGPLDIVVSNAGKSLRRSLHHQYDRPHDFQRTIDINYLGPIWLLLGTAAGHARKRRRPHRERFQRRRARGARVRNGAPTRRPKGAFDRWLRSVAPELHADGVDVTSVYFALVRTRMIAPTPILGRLPGLSAGRGRRRDRQGGHRAAPHQRTALGVPGRVGLGAAGRARRSRSPAVASPVLRRSRAPKRPAMTDGVVATTARALASSGLLSLPSPLAALRLIREVLRGGTNLYTLLAVAAARWPRPDGDHRRRRRADLPRAAGQDRVAGATSSSGRCGTGPGGRDHVPQRTRFRRRPCSPPPWWAPMLCW